MEQRLDCWTGMEDAISWTVSFLDLPENGRIQGQVRQWRSKLCIGVSQVRRHSDKNKSLGILTELAI